MRKKIKTDQQFTIVYMIEHILIKFNLELPLNIIHQTILNIKK